MLGIQHHAMGSIFNISSSQWSHNDGLKQCSNAFLQSLHTLRHWELLLRQKNCQCGQINPNGAIIFQYFMSMPSLCPEVSETNGDDWNIDNTLFWYQISNKQNPDCNKLVQLCNPPLGEMALAPPTHQYVQDFLRQWQNISKGTQALEYHWYRENTAVRPRLWPVTLHQTWLLTPWQPEWCWLVAHYPLRATSSLEQNHGQFASNFIVPSKLFFET